MEFIWPGMLALLLVVPLAAWLYLRLQQRRRQLALRYGSLGIWQGAGGAGPGARRHLPPVFFLAGLTILILALARPQAAISLPRVEGTAILVFDVSASMAAEDGSPTRMEAAKAAARQFVLSQPPSVQVGVVAFSDSSFMLQAPSGDQAAAISAIDRLTPQRGTSLAQGILAALNTLAVDAGEDPQGLRSNGDPLAGQEDPFQIPLPEGPFPGAVIVLFSDGENHEAPDPLAAAQAAAERAVRVYTVGVGSPAGVPLNVNGFTVHTRLQEELLQQIAQLTGGSYFNAGTEPDLGAVYEGVIPQLVVKPEKMEMTSIFAGASILVLLAGSLFSLLWFSRAL